MLPLLVLHPFLAGCQSRQLDLVMNRVCCGEGAKNREQVGKQQVQDNRATRGDPGSRCCPWRVGGCHCIASSGGLRAEGEFL